jgi:N-acylneuraminate cytidylyltransferase/CMP-N,N'-diacetyllegionaminic acid synthase
MYKNKRILALIPARGGSKGLPGKNILSFCGKPLIARTILEAQKSRYLDKVVVSTDDEAIAGVSRKYGACVPFLRPRKLATSTSNMIDVVLHCLDSLVKKNEMFDMVVLLQPTSPLRTTQDIDRAIELFFKKKATSVISVCVSEHHPWWSISLGKGFKVDKFLGGSSLHKNRQVLPDYFRINGAVYISTAELLREKRSFLSRNTYAYIMSPEKSIDIDNKIDFEFAEFLAKK